MADLSQSSDPNTKSSTSALSRLLKEWSHDAGFDLVGLAPATPSLGAERLHEWIAAGKQGEMEYMARNARAHEDPNLVLNGVRSVLVVALGYRTVEPNRSGPHQGRISRYAWGRDYHAVIREKLASVALRLRQFAPDVRSRIAVDSAPLAERDYARLAGLGWFGKNTLLLNKQIGSWFFLGAILLDCDLEYDAPARTDHCGTCRRCLDACPTNAFDGPYQLDPNRCISYLTIEHKTEIPKHLAAQMGDWVFGCDVCQDVCPWNAHAARVPPTPRPEFAPAADRNPVPLQMLLDMDDGQFRDAFRDTPIHRTGRARLRRNAMIAVDNANRQTTDVPPAQPKTTCPEADRTRRITPVTQDN